MRFALSPVQSSSSTYNTGEIVMNRIQKAATALLALAITLVGATLVTAPLTLSASQPVLLAALHG